MSMLSMGVGVLTETAADQMHEPWAAHDTQVLVVAALGIALVVVLIVWAKMHAFLALTISALLVGVFSGIPLLDVTKSYETGVGGVLGYVGVLIALGAMLGKLLGDSGGADRIVDTLLHGSKASLPWKMALIAGIIGIPMFFEVGLVLLVPVIMLAVHRSKGPMMLLAIPALAGLSVLHGFVPPHPGPVAAVGILHADIGITLALGLLVAVPTVVICGPLFGRLAAKWVPIGPAGAGLSFLGAGAGATGDLEGKQPADASHPGKHLVAGAVDDRVSAGIQGSRSHTDPVLRVDAGHGVIPGVADVAPGGRRPVV